MIHYTENMAGHQVPAIRNGANTWLLGRRGTIEQIPTLSLWLVRRAVISHLSNKGFFTPLGPDDLYHLTVLTSMACQARCPYCLQNEDVADDGTVTRLAAEFMTPATIRATIAFAKRMSAKQGKRGVKLLLFGGEPLLNLTGCIALLEGMQPELDSAGIITNGVLFDRNTACLLGKLGLHRVQITFDGKRKDHDRMRVLANGRGTYDTILANLEAIDDLEEPCQRTLRVNVTAANIYGLDELLFDLAMSLTAQRYTLNLALVDELGFGWTGGLRKSDQVTARLVEVYQLAGRLGFQVLPPTEMYCPYCSDSFGQGGAVVDQVGRLVSCWESAGRPELGVGTVWGGYKPASTHNDRWVMCGSGALNEQPEPSYDPSQLSRTQFEIAVRQMMALAS